MRLLSDNQLCKSTSNTEYRIGDYLGGGTQGEVYKGINGSRVFAVKWYFLQYATKDQHTILENLIDVGSPGKSFLWPIEIVKIEGKKGFGYVMQFRDPSFKGIVDLMKCKVEPSFKAITTAGYNLADSYLALHGKGMCYRDINFGNVFFHPETGETLICDNDNVTFVSDEHKITVRGTPKFMAPEIVIGKAEPSADTDRFSLSILLFYMFMVAHPLEGKKESAIHCLDLAANNRLYGTDPLFIFDPNDRSNEPDPEHHSNAIIFWSLYPEAFKSLFTQAFTKGLLDNNHRVRETVWRDAMLKLKDSIIKCISCEAENFYCIDKLISNQSESCWSCNSQLLEPLRMRTDNGNTLILNDTLDIFPHHIDATKKFDFSSPVGVVNRHPQNHTVLGLKNLTANSWSYINSNGESKEVEPNKTVKLSSGIKINFGSSVAVVR